MSIAGIIITTEMSLAQLHGNDYKSVREAVGGYIELVVLREEFEGYSLYVQEEGKILGSPMNDIATAVWERSFGIYTDIILGNAVLMSSKLDSEGNHLLIDDDEVEVVMGKITQAFYRYAHPSRSGKRPNQ